MAEYNYKFTPKAFKRLTKLPRDIQRRIFAKLDYFCETNPMFFAEKLTDRQSGEFRFRVGNYRIVFDFKGTMIIILDVGHRREIYR